MRVLFLLGSLVLVGPYLLGKEGGREEGGTKRGGAICRELPEDKVLRSSSPGLREQDIDGKKNRDLHTKIH